MIYRVQEELLMYAEMECISLAISHTTLTVFSQSESSG